MVESLFAEIPVQESLAKRVRTFFRDLLGSRVIEVMESTHAIILTEKEQSFAYLQEELERTRHDYEKRLLDKDEQLADLGAEKAMLTGKIIMYEQAVMPTVSRMGADVVAAGQPKRKPNFPDFDLPPSKSRWQVVQEEHEKTIMREIAEEQAKLPMTLAASLGGTSGG